MYVVGLHSQVGVQQVLSVSSYNYQMRLGRAQVLQGFKQVCHSLALVCNFLACEENQFLVAWQRKYFSGFLYILWSEDVVRNAVVYVLYVGLRHSLVGKVGNPLATSHELYVSQTVDGLFFLEQFLDLLYIKYIV